MQQNTVQLWRTSNPNVWSSTWRCRSLTPGRVCIARAAPITVTFLYPTNRFEASLAGGICSAVGVGSMYSPISGTYRCRNGDAGTFYYRRIRFR